MTASRVHAAPRRPGLLLWGILTAVVVVSSYLIALAIALGCTLLAVAGIGSLSAPGVLVGIASAVSALTIFWSVLPRRGRFDPPGALLDPAGQPRLFEEIAAIAAEFQEPMPVEAYLILEPNAWVSQVGGFLGFGTYRVIALGLPLLTTLTVSEFRAVLAHEFAHYYGGDTGFGPFVGKARDSLAGSLQRLSADSGVLAFLSRWAYVAIFRWLILSLFALYWKLFLRLTLLVSRRWEYRADELAGAVAGSAPLVRGLRKLVHTEVAWARFTEYEAVPALNVGVRPPLARGFAAYHATPNVSQEVAAAAAALLAAEKPEPLSSHPTLQQRTTRALSQNIAAPADDERPALSLLDRLPELEEFALQTALPHVNVAALRPVEWENLGAMVYAPSWYGFASEYRELLSDYRVCDIPQAILQLTLADKIRDPKGRLLTREQRADRCAALLANAISLALLDAGWQVCTHPGNFAFTRDEQRIVPAELVTSLRNARISPTEFRQTIEQYGIADLPLAPAPRELPAHLPSPLEAQGPRHLIIRPRLRVLRWQGAVLLAVCAFAGTILWLSVHAAWPLLLCLLAGVAGAVVELVRFRKSAPRAIVATPDFLAITWRDGRRQFIHWTSLILAEHLSPDLGCKWEFILRSEGPVVLRDTGIDPDRWALLRAAIFQFAGEHGAQVVEDSQTADLYQQTDEDAE